MAGPAVSVSAPPFGAALVLLDEAFHRLRARPGLLLYHALGSMPFGLGLLYFWSDMSRSAFAAERCASEALWLAGFYVWMKTCHSRFMTALYAQVAGQPDPAWSARRVARAAAMQAALQATAFPVLLLAAIVVLPAAWCITFYENAVLYGNGERRSLREVVRLSWTQAQALPFQNHALLTILSVSALFVCLELLVGLLFLPHLLRLFTGSETIFSLSGFHLLNSTLFAATGLLCYMVVDPLLKAACVLRCFQAQSLRTGEDLLLALREAQERRQRTTVGQAPLGGLLLLALLTTAAAPASAATPPPAPIAAPALEQSIARTLQQPRYSWRLPRTRPRPPATAEAGPIRRLFRQLNAWIRTAFTTCYDLLCDLSRWLRRWFGARDRGLELGEPAGSTWRTAVPHVVVLGTAVLSACLGLHAWRAWQRRRRAALTLAQPVAVALPDLADDAVSADQRPPEDWLRAARELIARGDLRLGLRAAYLASLALLAERRLLTIARHKSNLDYRRELARRAASWPAVVGCFDANVRLFDRVWYGVHPPSAAQIEGFLTDLERMRAGLES